MMTRVHFGDDAIFDCIKPCSGDDTGLKRKLLPFLHFHSRESNVELVNPHISPQYSVLIDTQEAIPYSEPSFSPAEV